MEAILRIFKFYINLDYNGVWSANLVNRGSWHYRYIVVVNGDIEDLIYSIIKL